MNNKIRTFFFFFCLSQLFLTLPNFENNHTKLDNKILDLQSFQFNPNTFNLSIDSPIFIDSDTGFISYGFSGNGSEQNPYLIQNLNIDTSSDVGLVVVNTTKSFIVQNCNITAIITCLHLGNNSGIFTKVYNNNLYNSQYYGIYSYLCPNISITDNRCYNNDIGLGVFFSDNSQISDNICFNNEAGLAIFFSDNNHISENICYENENGIVTQYLINATIVNNVCENNTYGINCAYAISLDICDNICIDSREGVHGYDVDYSTFSNNTITLSDNGFSLYGCDNNKIIENSFMFNYAGLDIVNSFNNNISSNECFKNTYGMRIFESHSIVIVENSCNENSLDGIYIRKSSLVLVLNNTCNDNFENGIFDSLWGMYIAESHEIIGNSCNNNTYGIQLDITQRIEVFNNTCTKNLQGIILKDSDSTDIIFNILQDNIEYGIYLDSKSTNNEIHHNDFINNNRKGTEFGKAQGYDDGFGNRWYDKNNEEGNYWSNLRNKKEYLLDGLRNSKDPYPLNSPVNNDIPHKTNFNVAISVISLISFTLCTLSLFRKKRIN